MSGGVGMKQIIIEIPETKKELKEFEKRIREIDKGAKEEVKKYRNHIDKEFTLGYKKPLLFPLNCETCKWCNNGK